MIKTLYIKQIFIVLFVYVLTGCDSSHQKIISTKKFEKEYEYSKVEHSMKHYEILDEKDGIVCLMKKEMSLLNKSKWNEQEICSKIDELRFSVRKELNSSINVNEFKE